MDERFAHLGSDPRFRPVPKKGQKIKIDNRFSSMFHDKNFKLKYSMDKRGKPINNSTSDDLKRYYEMSSNSSSEDSSNDEEENHINQTPSSNDDDDTDLKDLNKKIGKRVQFSDNTKQSVSDDSEDKDREVKVDLARGIGNVESSSSDDDLTSDDESSDEEEISHNWGELDKEAPQDDNVSSRLAICNMDWDRIKAVDLFVLANSFKPADGVINSVKIYPSDFGLQRMKEEELKGPTELVQETLKSDDEDYTETKEGSKYHMEKLRKYQLNRLKYFYAILECDTQLTASKLYEELDGMEYESSAAQLDLRFVPDDITFDHEPTSICDSLPDLATYQPVLFTTTALQQASVQLTWDETDPDRVRTIEKAFSAADEDEANLKNYLASSSEDEGFSSVEEKDENEPSTSQGQKSHDRDVKEAKKSQSGSAIEKYKALLADLEHEEQKSKEKDVTLEISWEPGLKGKAENLIKKREKMKDATAFEEFLEKKKEKKKLRKESSSQPTEKEASSSGADGEAFSDDEVPSDLDFNDPFFKEEIENIKKAKPKRRLKNNQRDVERDIDQGELELLTMDNEDLHSNKHFNLKN